MSLLNQYVQNHGQLGTFFDRLRQAQAPSKFSQQFLKDLGFTSSNFRAYIPLMKGLGFLSEDGTPKSEYMLLLDETQWKVAISAALKRSYSDIFLMKAKPGKTDRPAIIGKYKSTYNMNDLSAERAANTFLALLDLSDDTALYASPLGSGQSQQAAVIADAPTPPVGQESVIPRGKSRQSDDLSLVYNIQIHLPPTKDIEVYNAIFKSLREHLVS